MTAEHREARIRLQIELEEAEEALQGARLAAELHADLLHDLGDWLTESAETRIFRTSGSVAHDFDVQQMPEKHVRALDLRVILALGDEVRKAHRRLVKLRTRAERLTIKS